jgi:predicted small secreted protein
MSNMSRSSPLAEYSQKGFIMINSIVRRASSLLLLLGIAATVAGCHTAAGAGKDISKTGETITRAANDTTPR